jgi:hypothetical protein
MSPRDDLFSRELGSFLKSAASTLDEVKDSVLRGGQAGKASLDVQLLKRQRDKALARLGEVLLDEHARGAPLPPSCAAIVDEIRALDEQVARARTEAEKLWRGEGATGSRPAPPDAGGDDDDDDDQ